VICSKCRRDVLGGDDHGCRPIPRIDQLEAALVALIDAIDAGDKKRIEGALFVGRGLTF
jgi:hypothetical protein